MGPWNELTEAVLLLFSMMLEESAWVDELSGQPLIAGLLLAPGMKEKPWGGALRFLFSAPRGR